MTWMEEEQDRKIRTARPAAGGDRQQIVSDAQSGVDDAEGFLRAAALSTGEKAAQLRETATAALQRASEVLTVSQARRARRPRSAPVRSQMADQVRGALDAFAEPDPELARTLDAEVPSDLTFGRFSDHR